MSQPSPINEFGPCKVVILAGGFGTRLAERTDDLPKPMVEVGGRPAIWHILKTYAHHGFNDFLIAAGYRAFDIKRFFLEYRDRQSDLLIDFANDTVQRTRNAVEPWRVGVIDTGLDTLTGGRLKRLAGHLPADRTWLMTYGDGLCNVNINALLAFHHSHGCLATFTAVHPPAAFGRPVLDGDRVVTFAEKPADAGAWINGGFFALQPQVLDLIQGDASSFEADVLPRLAEADQLRAFRHEGFFHPMDTLRDVRALNRMWVENTAPWKCWDQPATHAARGIIEHKPESPCPPMTQSNGSSSPAVAATSGRSPARP